jgi:hypothetical protein
MPAAGESPMLNGVIARRPPCCCAALALPLQSTSSAVDAAWMLPAAGPALSVPQNAAIVVVTMACVGTRVSMGRLHTTSVPGSAARVVSLTYTIGSPPPCRPRRRTRS